MRIMLTIISIAFLAACSDKSKYTKSASTTQTAGAANTLNGQAEKLMNTKCAGCHDIARIARAGFGSARDISAMISEGKVVPGSPESSPIYRKVSANLMPPGNPLTDKEKALMATWIYNLYIDPNSAFGKVFNGLLQPRCLGCHGPSKVSGGVSFETYADTMKVVTAGKPDFSLMYQVVLSARMPKGKTPLSTAELQLLSGWISAGALR